jgi:hypothetical protein
MTERDDLRTADIADQRPADPPRHDPDLDEETELERRDDVTRRGDVTSRDDPIDLDRRDDVVAPAAQMDPDGTATTTTATATTAGPLLAGENAEAFRARWTDIQNGFVDAPRQAVEQADGLTAELMQHLAKTFADERGRLEGQWDRGDDVSTDDLRAAFQRYRSFFERLLAA